MFESLYIEIMSESEETRRERAAAAKTIRIIAEHPNWSSRPLIRVSLVRNARTPLSLSMRFLSEMRIMDLRELYADPSVPVTIKPFIHRELRERGEEPKKVLEDQVFELDEEEMAELEEEEVTRTDEDRARGEGE